jgi:subtilisin family serine protease
MHRPSVAKLAVLLVGLSFANILFAPPIAARVVSPIDPALRETLDAIAPDQPIRVIVTLADQVDPSMIRGRDFSERQRLVVQALRDKAERTQTLARILLDDRKRQGKVREYISLWIVNGFVVTADSAAINDLAKLPSVKRIAPDSVISAPRPVIQSPTAVTPEANISLINAPALWNLGYQGQGVVVANVDTGVDVGHADIAARWRGGTNSWYDPYGQHATPADVNGHGTWTMSVMVGGSDGGTAIGVAPQATWIAAKIFDDAGNATTSAIHLAFQWLLNPDGDPLTPDAPNLVNNSWSFNAVGCDLEFEPDLQALVAAGITPVFSAGNFGPNGSTDVSPGNNPSAFAVGATDNSDVIASFSSRGPTSCGRGSSVIYPAVVAPGVNIRVDDLYGMYWNVSGTSFSAPHVTGGLALLLSAYPNLTVAQQQAALVATAQDLGSVGADNAYGNGRIDLLAAYNSVSGGATPTHTPTSTPTNTATSTPSNTATSTPTSTATSTRTSTPTNTVTNTPTNTATSTPTSTATSTRTSTPTNTPTSTRTSTPTNTPTSTPPSAPTPTPRRIFLPMIGSTSSLQ